MHFLKDHGDRHITPSEITPQRVYQQRRQLLQGVAGGVALAGLAAFKTAQAQVPRPNKLAAMPAPRSTVPGAVVMDKLTPYNDVSSYNNFYEFGTDKADPAKYAGTLKTRPWTVAIEGEVKKPGSYDLDALLKLAPMEERIYRLRCVEGWSMVVPWVGYSLAELIKRVEPTGNAKFVQFVTLADRAQMPGLSQAVLDWPYTEGLRLDEAMHPLTLLAFGLYGEVLPKQNGAPLRLVVPWKYGFKSGKSLVKIRFTDKQPKTSWEAAIPDEYGFYSNVNPKVDHPRWSQATERRLGEDGLFAKKRPTLMFNGYEAAGRPALHRHGPEEILLNWGPMSTAARAAPARSGLPINRLLMHGAAKPLLFLLALLPLGWLVWGAVNNTLGANPAETLIRSTGDWTLRALCLTLAVTPLRQLTGWHALARLRRMLGLFTFFYGALHFLAFAWLDMGLDLAAIVADIPKRPFILVGTAALLLMLPLAATSFNAAIKAWAPHVGRRCTAPSTPWHCWRCCTSSGCAPAKTTFAEVAIYAAIVATLLGWRAWRRFVPATRS